MQREREGPEREGEREREKERERKQGIGDVSRLGSMYAFYTWLSLVVAARAPMFRCTAYPIRRDFILFDAYVYAGKKKGREKVR